MYTRRELIQHTPAIGFAAALLGAASPIVRADEPASKSTLGPEFPRQDAKHVQEVVGAAHRDLAKVKELVKAHPALANAWWDWGFGDWESALGAASHTGRREIAEFLLESGARIDIFAAAMLGMTDVVKAFVTAQPGVQKTLGPHGIPLLAHAKFGGKKAADTLAYLESLGDAGNGLKVTPLPADRKPVFIGIYATEDNSVRIDCRANSSGQLVVEIQTGKSTPSRPFLHYLGDDEFFPSGVPSVRIRFAVENSKATSLTIRESTPILTAKRV